jgi:collagenase-like PrtC family protease
MVCARELSKNEIKELCAASPIEIEQFVHGAMCVSQSGQCLASAVMGGRSGNRGVCAQPCRMKYNGRYPLSLKDMCLAQHVTELIESGVASLKIEGRMKSPAYVYEVVSVYRRLLDEARNASKSEMQTLANVFSRGGFTDGYYTERISQDMLGVRSEGDKNASASVRTDFRDLKHSLPEIMAKERTPIGEVAYTKPPKKQGSGKPILTARFTNPQQVCRQDLFSHVYLPLEKYESGVCDGVVFPPSVFGSEKEKFMRDLERAVSLGATEAIVCHVGQVEIAKKYGLNVHGDYRLNVFNSSAARFYTDMGLRDVILSPELTLPQIRDINAPKSVIVYGRLPIMLLTKPVDADFLTDKTGAVFPVIKENGRDILLNSVPIYMADKQGDLDTYGVRGRHFIFTTESKKECFSVLDAYKDGRPSIAPIRRILK